MQRRLAEQLIVPESDGTTQQLRGGRCDGRMPKQIVQADTDPPGAQGMKQHSIRISRLVRVILVPELAAGVAWLSQHGKFSSQLFNLKRIQYPWPHDKTMLTEAGELLVTEPPWSAI